MQAKIIRREDEIEVRDEAGSIRILLKSDSDDPACLFFDRSGEPAGGLSFDHNDELVISLTDSQGRVKLALAMIDGEPMVFAVDGDGRLTHARHALDPPATIGDLAAARN